MSSLWQGCFADTDYFELRSSRGYDYGVWVTSPPGYDPETAKAPVVYVLDGNWAVGQTAPLIVTQVDPIERIQPYIQVSVGYAGDEAQQWASLRNRDLVPPGEPVAQEYVDALEMSFNAGTSTREEINAHIAELQDTHADAFLAFLTDELHPRIERDYHAAPSGHGLFGYSYGGLFTLYAWLTGNPLFETIGAGSSGVATEGSRLFTMLEELGDTLPPAKLHVTMNERELLGKLEIYQNTSRNTANLLHQFTVRGGTFTSEVLHETHLTGLTASFLSYLRTSRAG